MRKRFPSGNLLHKIFNKNTLKITTSFTGNMPSIISTHNRIILNPDVSLEYRCNWRSRNEFPLQYKCLTPEIVYRVNVASDINDEKSFYFGVSETPLKQSFRNHKKEFNDRKIHRIVQIHLAVKIFKHNAKGFVEIRSSNQVCSQNKYL